jgi:hypothetical protein
MYSAKLEKKSLANLSNEILKIYVNEKKVV